MLLTLLCAVPGMAEQRQDVNSRFVVQRNGKFGYIERTGELVLPATLYAASDFGDGVAVIMPSPRTGAIIDADGKTLGRLPLYKSIQPFSEGLAVVMQDENHWGFVNPKAEVAIPLKFSAAASFSEGLAAVADASGKWGWIDKSGKVVIPPQFSGGGQFKEGMARFSRGSKSGYVDKTGKTIVEATYFTAQDFSEGFGLVWDGKNRRFFDKTGKMVIEFPASVSVGPFQEGLAAIKNGSEVGFIDKTGKMALRVPFDGVSAFSEGLAPVRSGSGEAGKWGCIH